MTYNKKNIFAVFAITAALALTPTILASIYAEEVIVDIPASDERVLIGCNWIAGDTQAYSCVWDYPVTTEEFENLVIGASSDTDAPPLIEIPDAIEMTVQVVEEEEILTPKQTAIQYLQGLKEEGKIMPSENEVLRLLLDAQQRCEFGIEEGEAIQTYAYFDVPQSQVDITRSFNYDRNHLLSSIAKLIESCDHWNSYKQYGLGPEYSNKMVADRDAVEAEFKRLADLESLSHTYDSLSSNDLLEAAEDAYKTICAQEGFSNYVKSNYGCEDLKEDPNRGGFVDVSENPIYQQYLKSKETGENVVNPDLTPDDYINPLSFLAKYMETYQISPDEIAEFLASQGVRGE